MSDFTIRSIASKGNFEVLKDDSTLLFTVEYKSWFSGEASSNFDKNDYSIKSANFWQTQFDISRNFQNIGKISFNWKGEIIINYTSSGGTEKEFLFSYKGVWKFRFIVSDRSGNEVLAMASSWSKLKYHYNVSLSDEAFRDK